MIILMNMTLESMGAVYHIISFCILFLSFCYNFNVIFLCSFFNVFIF